MSALHSRDTCFGYKQVSSRAWTSTAVPVGLCIKLVVCVVMLWAVQSCCRRTEVTLTQFCLLEHKALLSSYMLRIPSHFKLFGPCKCFNLFLPFILTNSLTETNSYPSHQRNQPSLLLAVLNYGHEMGGVGDLPISLFPTKETAVQQSGMLQCSWFCSRDPILMIKNPASCRIVLEAPLLTRNGCSQSFSPQLPC